MAQYTIFALCPLLFIKKTSLTLKLFKILALYCKIIYNIKIYVFLDSYNRNRTLKSEQRNS